MLPALMQATSRESLARLREQLEQKANALDASSTKTTADELADVARVLGGEAGVRRALSDPSASGEVRSQLVTRLFGSQVGETTLEIISAAATSAWSTAGDLVDALSDLGHQAAFIGAEKDSSFGTVEEEIFRFGRVLDANAELEQRLSDPSVPLEQRQQLLGRLTAGKTDKTTEALLKSVLANPRVRSVQNSVEGLVDAAAARRRRSVAIVKAPVALSAQQEQRLTASLSRIYGREISVSVDVDPTILGGIRVQVGEDVIDGSITSQLEAIQRRFAG